MEPSGGSRDNALTISNKLLELMHKYLSKLGLSPVARTRVQTRTPGMGSRLGDLLHGYKRP
jgi:hypothetical protein